MSPTKRTLAVALALCCGALFAVVAGSRDPIARALLAKALPDVPGKEVLVLEVEYPPGGADPVHRHDAHGFIYVLEGEVVMGVHGGQPVTLRPGDTFYEGPGDVHTIDRNASTTRRARFLAVLVKNEGAEPVILPK